MGSSMGLSFMRFFHFHSGQKIPDLPTVSCSRCSSSAAIVFDRPTGRFVRFCVSCQLVVPHDSVALPPQPPIPPTPALPPNNDPPVDWFSHGPLSSFPSLCGWGRGDPTPPGSGTQSWLFCPLISLGLALAESRLGVPPYSTGNREQVPSEQSQFWATHALPIIHAYANHFHSLDRSLPAAALLQSWEGGHLDSVAQEVVTPPNIMSMIAVWLSDTVTHFRQGGSSPTSAPPPPPFPPSVDAPLPCLPVDPPVNSQAPSPFIVAPSPTFGPLLPLCRLQLPLLQGRLTFLLLWLQAPLLSTLLHHPLSPRLQFLRFPASLHNLSLALLS